MLTRLRDDAGSCSTPTGSRQQSVAVQHGPGTYENSSLALRSNDVPRWRLA
jgi:hypothetical protein